MADLIAWRERLDRIADFVQRRLREVGVQQRYPAAEIAYRWQHTLRVCHYGRVLAEAEGADAGLVLAACLLHDVAAFDEGPPQDHGRRGAEIARPFLEGLGCSPAEVEAICYAVASHVDVDCLETPAAKVVTDADNIDRFGAYRILLWCREDLDDFDRLAARLSARVEQLADYRRRRPLETPTGNALFDRQLELQLAVFQAILQEKEITRLPAIPLPFESEGGPR